MRAPAGCVHSFGYHERGLLTTDRLDDQPAEIDQRLEQLLAARLTWHRTESRVASFDARDRLLSDGVASYTYDDAGRRATKTVGSEITRYGYDELGQLTRVELPDGRVVEYTYDAVGRRTGRTTDGAVDGPEDTAWVYGAGPAALAKLDGTGALQAVYVYGSRSWVPDLMLVPNGASPLVFAYVTDHRGSVRSIVGTRPGLETFGPADYDAFGRLSASAQTRTRIAAYGFSFAGGMLDENTGLIHLGARDYDPETGTWIEPDPIRFAGGDTNLYAYVGGDPVNGVDPSGLVLDTVLDLIFIGVDLHRVYSDNIEGNCGNLGENLLALGAEGLGVVLPFVTGLGAVVHARRGEEAIHTVYRAATEVKGVERVTYVGRTNNLPRRALEHLRASDRDIQAVISGLTRSEAKGVERALIEFHGLSKNKGTLQNLINSVARSNPRYASRLQTGRQILHDIGYPGF